MLEGLILVRAGGTNLLVRLLLLVIIVITVVVGEVLVILIILILKVAVHTVTHTLKLAGLAGEPVNGSGDKLLLDVLTKLVVELEAVLDIVLVRLILVKVRGRSGRGEEVEEALGGNGALDNTGLLGV